MASWPAKAPGPAHTNRPFARPKQHAGLPVCPNPSSMRMPNHATSPVPTTLVCMAYAQVDQSHRVQLQPPLPTWLSSPAHGLALVEPGPPRASALPRPHPFSRQRLFARLRHPSSLLGHSQLQAQLQLCTCSPSSRPAPIYTEAAYGSPSGLRGRTSVFLDHLVCSSPKPPYSSLHSCQVCRLSLLVDLTC